MNFNHDLKMYTFGVNGRGGYSYKIAMIGGIFVVFYISNNSRTNRVNTDAC